MRNILRSASFLALALFISCSEDEGTRDLGQNGFSHNTTFYVLNNAFFNDENVVDETPSDLSLTLSNVNIVTANAISNVSKVYFNFSGITLQAGTYTAISDYSVETGGSFGTDGAYTDGTFLLDSSQSGLTATETTLIINSVTEETIDLTFNFVKSDGQVLSGKYVGNLIDVSVSPQ